MSLEGVNVQGAIAALDKMAGVAKAFSDARVVLDALANAEQVLGEMGKQIDARKAELATLQGEIEAVNATLGELKAHGKKIIDDANTKAGDAERAAANYVTQAHKDADARVAKVNEDVAAKQAEADAIAATVADAKAELDALNSKIAAAKEAAKAILA